MEEDLAHLKNFRDRGRRVLPDFTCRLCLYENKDNADILGPAASTSDLLLKISRHLPIKVTMEDKTPMWICKFCQRSLESFHSFYSKVMEIQERLTNLFIAAEEKCFGAPLRLNEEIYKIETTVGFRRGKKIRTQNKTGKADSTRMITRNQGGIGRIPKRNQDSSTSPADEKGDGDDTRDLDPVISNKINGADSGKDRTDDPDLLVLIKTEDNEETSGSNTTTMATNPGLLGNNVSKDRDDDLSSLEDQDWVGQGFNFEIDSDDESCKPPGHVRNRRSTRKRKTNEEVDKDASEYLRNIDDPLDNEPLSEGEIKKAKLRITATHGTEPKPKTPPGVHRMLRAEMNARFVEFYGITCDICVKNIRENSLPEEPVKYDSFEALCAHMLHAHNKKGYVKCCNCTMRERKRAERHMLLHTQPGSIYKCNICGKQLSSQQSFRCHILLHLPHSERPFQCNQCDRGFATKGDLATHERQHLPEDKRYSFTCDICGSRFTTETGLQLHKQRVHENFRPHLCDLCAKSFSSRSDMERHRAQTHGIVKREQCPECGKWFKGPEILKSHLLQHKGQLFKCQYCDKTYTVRSSYKAHLINHSDEKPHKCPVCDKSFKLPGTLKMHLNQHTGELPYSCQYCPKKFASSGNYYTHRKRMHGEEVARQKQAIEDHLNANGFLPPSTNPPAKVTLSQAIARAKEKVAAKEKAAASSKENPAPLALTKPSISSNFCVSPPLQNVLCANTSSANTMNVLMTPPVPLAQVDNNDVFTKQSEIISTSSSVPVALASLNSGNEPVYTLNKNAIPAGMKVFRLISPAVTNVFRFVKPEQSDVSGLPGKMVALPAQPLQTSDTVSREDFDSETNVLAATMLSETN